MGGATVMLQYFTVNYCTMIVIRSWYLLVLLKTWNYNNLTNYYMTHQDKYTRILGLSPLVKFISMST